MEMHVTSQEPPRVSSEFLNQRWLKEHLHAGDALDAYATWPTPATIVSDGAYGIGGFPGDPRTPEGLAEWYEAHVEAWSKHAHPSSTLWFWNTEIGCATVHPVLVKHGWEYVETVIWDKGIAHIAGNVNGETINPPLAAALGPYPPPKSKVNDEAKSDSGPALPPTGVQSFDLLVLTCHRPR